MAEVAYIVSIHGTMKGGIASIPTAYPLDSGNLRILQGEVRAYWKTLAVSSQAKTSVFVRPSAVPVPSRPDKGLAEGGRRVRIHDTTRTYHGNQGVGGAWACRRPDAMIPVRA